MLLYKGLPIKMRKKFDNNGNRVVTISIPNSRGFSIQTNQNLPKTHVRSTVDEAEVMDWVLQYGTLRQKEIFREVTN